MGCRDASAPSAGAYRPRNPRASPLYHCVARHAGELRAARVAALTAFAVLTAFTLLGEPLLAFFGVRLAAFSVAGGLLLLLLALSMVGARISPQRQIPEEAQEAAERQAVGVVQLGVPLLAGPGAITHVIVAANAAPGRIADRACC